MTRPRRKRHCGQGDNWPGKNSAKLIGVGDFRVEKKGWFGKYRYEIVSIVAQEEAA